jgi:FkbM family methyltransferase
VRPSVPDPPPVEYKLWDGFRGETGWDVGANCGQTVLSMAFDFSRIFAFEPSPDSFEYMERSLARHRIPATLMNIALSDHDGELVLAYPAEEQKETGQLVTVGIKGMEWEPKDWEAVEKVTVPCRTVDSLASELGVPDFMKIDTEGHEFLVLQGAPKVVEHGHTDMLIEFHSPENHHNCLFLLECAGYRLETVRHPFYAPESTMWYQHGWVKAFSPRN